MQTNCVAIIPARGGSKRIPKKNIKDFFGKPLIAYSIEVAIRSKLFSKIIVSTDDEEIATIAKKYGAEVPLLRPKELSDDFTGTKDVIDHTINYLEEHDEKYNYVCTIYATAPLLQEKYLQEGYTQLINSSAKHSFSATSMPFPIQRTFKINNEGRCEMFTPENFTVRSQDLEEAYQDAGQFYWENQTIKSNEIIFGKDSIPIIIPRNFVQDIDTLEDWKCAEILYEVISRKNMSKIILFRADSSSKIGTGHIMRNLVLASQYHKKGYQVIFAVQNFQGNINNKIVEAGYKIELLKSNKESELSSIIQKYNIKEIVIDHYKIDWKFEKKLKNLFDIHITSFDDIYLKHNCNTIYNHNIYANKNRYIDLVPKGCTFKCGSKYTLLRDEFIQEKNKKTTPINNNSIFISMGGADTANLNIKILKTLIKIPYLTINLVTTEANTNLNSLKKYVKDKKNIHLHINSNQIAVLLSQTSLAIITPSVIANEVSYMNIPFIAIKITNNQKEMYKYFKKKNIPVLKSFNKDKLLKKVKQYLLEKK